MLLKLASIVVILLSASSQVQGSSNNLSDRTDCRRYPFCGLESLSTRVYKGSRISKNQFPWLSHIVHYLDHTKVYSQCGGSLISNEHVITSAHCVIDDDNQVREHMVKVYLGVDSVDNSDLPKPRRVKRIIFNEGFLRERSGNDFAILQLHVPVNFSSTVAPICVPSDTAKTILGKTMTVVGWGLLGATGDFPNVANSAPVTLLNRTDCQSRFRRYFRDNFPTLTSLEVEKRARYPKSEICALNVKTGADACRGDSGAPLMYKNPGNGRYYLVGTLASSWDSCGEFSYLPSLYSRVWKHLPRISSLNSTACILSLNEVN